MELSQKVVGDSILIRQALLNERLLFIRVSQTFALAFYLVVQLPFFKVPWSFVKADMSCELQIKTWAFAENFLPSSQKFLGRSQEAIDFALAPNVRLSFFSWHILRWNCVFQRMSLSSLSSPHVRQLCEKAVAKPCSTWLRNAENLLDHDEAIPDFRMLAYTGRGLSLGLASSLDIYSADQGSYPSMGTQGLLQQLDDDPFMQAFFNYQVSFWWANKELNWNELNEGWGRTVGSSSGS